MNTSPKAFTTLAERIQRGELHLLNCNGEKRVVMALELAGRVNAHELAKVIDPEAWDYEDPDPSTPTEREMMRLRSIERRVESLNAATRVAQYLRGEK